MSDRPAPHVWQAAVATCWAMLPERIPAIFEIAARENLGDGGLEAIAARIGRPLDNTRSVTVRDGVAVIPVEGVIVPRAGLFSDISGGVSVDTLAADFATALADPGISGIVFLVDSPGGDKNGVPELAGAIYAARGQKPGGIVAYGREMVASGSYWLAAACERVVVAPDAFVGSIGVVTAVADPSQRSSRSIEFVSSKSPHKRLDPTTQAGQERILARVDAVADIFIGDVAKYRGVSVATVESDFGQGDMFVGQAAKDVGLVDEIGSFEGVVAAVQAKAREPRRIGSSGRMAAQTAGGSMAEQTRFQRFMAWLDGKGDASFLSSDADENKALGDQLYERMVAGQPDPAVVKRLQEAVARADAAEARLAEARAAEAARATADLDARATAFADGEIRASRALPAERESLIAAFADAAHDDADHPRGEGRPTRVMALTERQAQRPASALLGELVPVREEKDGSLVPLTNLEKTAFASADQADAPLTLERRIQIMAMTETGRAELRRQNIPIPVVVQQ